MKYNAIIEMMLAVMLIVIQVIFLGMICVQNAQIQSMNVRVKVIEAIQQERSHDD